MGTAFHRIGMRCAACPSCENFGFKVCVEICVEAFILRTVHQQQAFQRAPLLLSSSARITLRITSASHLIFPMHFHDLLCRSPRTLLNQFVVVDYTTTHLTCGGHILPPKRALIYEVEYQTPSE